jgi:cell wall-associated NlpC family hydrolase
MKHEIHVLAFPATALVTLVAALVYLMSLRITLSGADVTSALESEGGISQKDTQTESEPFIHVGEANDPFTSSESTIRFLISDLYALDEVAVVNRDFAEIHAAPGAGIVTEAVYLEPLIVVSEAKSGWLKVELPLQRGYVGFVSKSNVSYLPSGSVRELAVVASMNTWATSLETGERLRLLPVGTVLPVINSVGSAWQVRLLEGTAWVGNDDVRIITEDNGDADGEAIVRMARSMLGTPYAWGGTTQDHLDCSGFVHLVFRLNGRIVPRDCDLQFDDSEDTNFELDEIKPGDLIYLATYKDEASHVGIYTGDMRVIHASSRKGVVEESIAESTFARHRILGYRRYADSP